MTIFELSRTLGEAIRDTPETQRALKARAVYDADEQAQALLQQYGAVQEQYGELLSGGQALSEEAEELGRQLRELSKEINQNPVIMEVMNSEDDFNRLVQGVFGIINATITGEDQSCSGSCSSCGGSCPGCC